MEIFLAPEILFTVGSVAVTNALLTGFVVVTLICLFFAYVTSNLKVTNPGRFQVFIELVISSLFNMIQDIMGFAKARKLFGYLFTFFIFILFSNWYGLLPLTMSLSIEHTEEEMHSEESLEAPTGGDVAEDHAFDADAKQAEQVEEHTEESAHPEESHNLSFVECIKNSHCYITLNGLKEFHGSKHIFRAPSSDLSATISLALISVVMTNILGLVELRLGYVKKFLYFLNFPQLVKKSQKVIKNANGNIPAMIGGIGGLVFDFFVNTFVGLLEIVSELGKVVSFSFRLLGNIFAGEVLLIILTGITFGLATLPFLGLEIFVGIIQALVFFMLTAVSISLATTPHDEH